MKEKTKIILAIALVLVLLDGAVFSFAYFVLPSLKRYKQGNQQTVPDGECSLEAYFFDVGDGSAAVFISDGHVLVVDGGPSEYSNLIYSFLRRKNISYIDYIVATHPDADHIGGLSGALNAASVGTVYCTVTEHDTKTFRSLKKYVEQKHREITVPDVGDTFTFGSCTAEVLGPEKGVSYSDNTSVVLKLRCGKVSFLLMGDSERDDEKFLMSSGADLKSDFLLVGHHGSSTSTYRQFAETVRPRYAVISTGENRFGHPTEIVLKNLTNVGAEIYRTDLLGDIYCRCDGKDIYFSSPEDR